MTTTARTRRTLLIFASASPLAALALLAIMPPRSPALAPALAQESPDSEPTTKARPRIVMVTNNASDFWEFARQGGEQAARKLPGIEFSFKMPAQGDAAEQTQLVQDQLDAGAAAMIISPVDPANQGDMLNRAAKKALLFTFDTDAPRSNRLCYIGTDNVAAGRRAGEALRRALPRGGQVIAFVGKIDTANARERFQGIRQALRGSRVRLLGAMTDNADRALAKSNVLRALRQHPRLAGMVGLWSYNGPAILSTLQDAKKVGRVKIVAFDDERDTLDGVRSGAISAAIVQQPELFGRRSVQLMAQVLAGNRGAIPASRKVFIPTRTITKSNIASYQAYHKKMLAQ